MNDKKETDVGVNSRALAIGHNEQNVGLASLNLFDEKQLIAAENLLTKVMRSEKGGIKTINDGLAILMRAQDLQLPFSTCIEHIHVINGKTGVDVHIIKSLLSRAGVTWECTKDYAPQYKYTDGNTIYIETQLPDYCVKCRNAKEAEEATKDGMFGVYPLAYYQDLKGNVYDETQVSDKCVKAINKAHALKLAADKQFPVLRVPAIPIDYVTEYKFARYRIVNGKEVKMTSISHFSYTEAQAAELFKKETYTKYARVLIGHRAFTLGARDIASDLLMGVMESSEIKLVEDIGLSPSDFIPVEEVN